MPMRLLPKKEIDQLKAKARQREIDEGLKLTRRVDSIRKTIGEEEAKLEKFRRETTAAIQAEIIPLEETRNDLVKEVRELRQEREQLLVPLDKEWYKIEKAKLELKDEQEKLYKERLEIRADQKEVTEEKKKAREARLSAEAAESTALDKQKDAIIKRRDASENLDYSERTRKEADVYAHGIRADIAEEHRKLDLRKEALDQREKQLQTREIEMQHAEVQYADRMATLERALKRKS